MRIIWVCFFLLVSGGCSTLDGLKKDFQDRLLNSSEQSQSPIEACESVYRRIGAGNKYKQCLSDQVLRNLSPNERYNLQFVRAFPKCASILGDRDAQLSEYCECQSREFSKVKGENLAVLREEMNWHNNVISRKSAPAARRHHGKSKQ